MRTTFFTLLFFLSGLSFSQEIPVTQQLLNPSNKFLALSGYHGALQVNAIAQSSIPIDGYVMANVGVDGYIHKIRSGIGFNLNHNQYLLRNLGETELAFHIAPKFRLSDNAVLLSGIALNLYQIRNDFTQISVFYSDNPFIKVRSTANWINASVGAGIKVHQFMFLMEGRYITNSDAVQYYFNEVNPKLRRQFSVYLTNHFDVSSDFSVAPIIEMNLTQDPFDINEIGLGGNTFFNGFQAGFKLLLYQGAAAQFGYNFNNSVLISYSYYYHSNQLSSKGLLAHEIGIRATLFKNKAKKVYYENLGLL